MKVRKVNEHVCVCVSVCLCLSVSVCLSLSLSLSLCVCVCVFVWVYRYATSMSTYYHTAKSGGRGGANDDSAVIDASEASSPGTKTLLSERLKQVKHSSQPHS